MTQPTTPPPVTWRQLQRSTRLALIALLLVLVCGGLEVAARAYWQLAKGASFARTDLIWKRYFPEWDESGIDAVARDGTFDVLFLGGSTLTDIFGQIGPELRSALQARLGRPVRIVNLAAIGRTTLDSRLKYERLGARRFDLLVVYHGVNDTYLNNVPPGAFRSDYTHAERFEQLRLLDAHPEVGALSFPFTLRYAISRVREQTRMGDQPRREWHQYGADMRTPPIFRANLERIVRMAEERDTPVVLMTYAYYVPADYTEEAFRQRSLDYGAHTSPISLWGTPEHVARAIDLHNTAVRDLAAQTPGAVFVDQQQLMPVGKDYFDDCCHLTALGSRRFVEHVMAALPRRSVGASAGPPSR